MQESLCGLTMASPASQFFLGTPAVDRMPGASETHAS